MESRIVPPESLRLPLSGGEWVLVKKRLNAGEHKKMIQRGQVLTADGFRIDPVEAGTAKLLAYLCDWSLPDQGGQTIGIRDQPAAVVEAALDSIDLDSYSEILRAVEAHEQAMQAERDAQKKIRPGDPTSSAPSPSPAPVDSPTTGSSS